MRYILTIFAVLLFITPAHAIDKKLGATNCFKVGIFDTVGNGITGLDVVWPYDHTVTKVQCGGNSVTTMDESGDTITDELGGYYYICTNDAITNNPEEECLGWIEGQGNMVSLIAKTPVKFKAIGATIDAAGLAAGAITDTAMALSAIRKGSPLCDITTPATSGSSFTVSCTNSEGGAITLAADKWIGTIWRAYTNGGAACNVVDEKIRMSAITSGGLVTAQNDAQFKPFTLTPNTSNCGIYNP